jgi:hypothetical protein
VRCLRFVRLSHPRLGLSGFGREHEYHPSDRARAARKKCYLLPHDPGTRCGTEKPLPAFVVVCRAGYQLRSNERAATALPRTAPDIQSAPTCRTLPACGVSSTRLTPPMAPDITPEAARLPRLVRTPRPVGRVASGRYPTGPSSYVHGFRRGIVATEVPFGPFSGEKLQAPGYPSMTVVRSSAPPPSGLTGKPYAFGPLTVELFAVGFLSPDRRVVSATRLRPSRARKLPAPAEVVRRNCFPLTPSTGFASKAGDAPAWHVTSPAGFSTRRGCVPVAPRPRGDPSGRTLGLVLGRGFRPRRKDYSSEPPPNRTSHSRGIRL